MTPALDEDGLIARFFAPIAGPGGLGLRDDAAIVRPPPGHDLVVTVDALVSGGHFFPDDPPESVARKALGVNLSDLAAKGADPLGFTLALALPEGWSADWLEAFARGLGAAAEASGCQLLGGDTVKARGPLTLSITALGAVPAGRMVPRTGARPGDRLYVSGTVGDAALGLRLRLEGGAAPPWAAHLLDRYLHPRPRLALRAALRGHASGAMDVSDGFVGDLAKMMRASATTAAVDLAAVPLSEAARAAVAADAGAFEAAMTGGDDYEILASVPEAEAAAFEAAAFASGVPVSAVGRVAAGGGAVAWRGLDGAPRSFDRGSFSHF